MPGKDRRPQEVDGLHLEQGDAHQDVGDGLWRIYAGFLRDHTTDPVVWITRDARAYTIDKMDTRHIRNCIANILIRDNWRGAYMPLLTAELKRRMLDEERAANGDDNHDEPTLQPGDGGGAESN